jgi:hypothetical protein
VEWDAPAIVTISVEGFGSATVLREATVGSYFAHELTRPPAALVLDWLDMPPHLEVLCGYDSPFADHDLTESFGPVPALLITWPLMMSRHRKAPYQ